MKLFALVALAASLAMPATARNCAPHEDVVENLLERYDETRRAIAIHSDGLIMEIFASEGGSWTITLTGTDGMSCLVAAGEAYEQIAAGSTGSAL